MEEASERHLSGAMVPPEPWNVSFTTKDGKIARIRAAVRGDARPCVAILAEAARSRPRTLMATSDDMWTPRQWRRHMLGPGHRGTALVADVDGSVAGFLGAIRGERPAVRHTCEVGITVAERWRGIGVGRALMGAAERWCRSVGVEKMLLGVYASNDRARRLYESLGYRVEGTERAQVKFPEGYVDTVRMAKFLTEIL